MNNLIESANKYMNESTVVDFSKDDRWSDAMYNEPTKESLKKLKIWIKQNKNDPFVIIRMYHGTDASLPIEEEGLKPTSSKRRHSLQSRSGYVSLSVFPGMAKTFGEFAYPKKEIAVYSVDIPITKLVPDIDQLKNKRLWGGGEYDTLGNTLADSIAYGHGAQVKGSIPKYMINKP